jgi:GT2 family glycosyltransferase
MITKKMKTAIIIVNYNGGQTLKDTVNELYKKTDSKETPFDIFLVDNASKDKSYLDLKKKYPDINLIESKENLGFGKANNLILEELLKSHDYDFTALVNPDMKFTRNWLTQLLETAHRHPHTAAVNPLILYEDKFNAFTCELSNPEIYLSSDDYRFIANLVGDESSATTEITLNGEQFIQPNTNSFKILNRANSEFLHLHLYDEKLEGYSLLIGDLEIQQSKVVALNKKIIYRLNKNIDLKIKKLKIKVKDLKVKEEQDRDVEIINSLGSEIRPGKNLPENRFYGQYRQEAPSTEHKVELFHGACALISLEALRHTGLFDPKYFMYYEESDLSMRMKEKDYKIYANPNSVVYHLERGSKSSKSIEFMQESQKIFTRKWRS